MWRRYLVGDIFMRDHRRFKIGLKRNNDEKMCQSLRMHTLVENVKYVGM